jgi:putative membrane protein
MDDGTRKADLAKERTDWAEDRTILASERTFAGWVRTGLACVAVSLGLHALFGEFQPTLIPKLLSNLFILTAIAIFLAAYSGVVRTQKRMISHAASTPSNESVLAITVTLVGASVGTGIVLWLL